MAAIESLIKSSNASMANEITAGDQLIRSVTIFMLAVSVIGLVLSYVTVRAIVSNLNRIIDGLGTASTEVLSAANQISTSSQDLAEGSTEQAASLSWGSAGRMITPCITSLPVGKKYGPASAVPEALWSYGIASAFLFPHNALKHFKKWRRRFAVPGRIMLFRKEE